MLVFNYICFKMKTEYQLLDVTYHKHSKCAEVVTLTDHPVQKLVTNSLASICAPITLTTCCDVIR